MGAAETGVAGYIAAWRPVSVPPQAACFARAVVGQAAPAGRERAKNLLWAAGKLASWAIGLGLDLVPEVLLHPSVIERFTAHAPGLTGVNAPHAAHEPAVHRPDGRPAAVPGGPAAAPRAGQRPVFPGRDRRLPRPRRCPADGGAADAGGGAGLPGRRRRAYPRRPAAGTRHRHHRPVRRRHRRGSRPQAAGRAGAGPLPRPAAGISAVRRHRPGHRRTGRHNVTTPLITALAGGTGLPRLDTSRLRATWLADCAELLGLATFLHAAGITCSQRLGDIIATLQPGDEAEAVALLGAQR